MRTLYFSIHRDYEIKCKMFLPDNQNMKSIIIGVHGFAGDKESSMLEQLAQTACLAETGLVCFDFPAHGESPVQEDKLTIENCKKDFLDVLNHFNSLYKNVDISIFATSFGGYITLLCSDQLTDYPLVLRASAVTMPKVLLENVLEISAEEFQKTGTVTCGFERSINLPYGFYQDLMTQENIMEKVIHQRSLILHGDCDDIVPLSDILAFANRQEKVEVEIVHGADHRFKKEGEIEQLIQSTRKFLNI